MLAGTQFPEICADPFYPSRFRRLVGHLVRMRRKQDDCY